MTYTAAKCPACLRSPRPVERRNRVEANKARSRSDDGSPDTGM